MIKKKMAKYVYLAWKVLHFMYDISGKLINQGAGPIEAVSVNATFWICLLQKGQ